MSEMEEALTADDPPHRALRQYWTYALLLMVAPVAFGVGAGMTAVSLAGWRTALVIMVIIGIVVVATGALIWFRADPAVRPAAKVYVEYAADFGALATVVVMLRSLVSSGTFSTCLVATVVVFSMVLLAGGRWQLPWLQRHAAKVEPALSLLFLALAITEAGILLWAGRHDPAAAVVGLVAAALAAACEVVMVPVQIGGERRLYGLNGRPGDGVSPAKLADTLTSYFLALLAALVIATYWWSIAF